MIKLKVMAMISDERGNAHWRRSTIVCVPLTQVSRGGQTSALEGGLDRNVILSGDLLKILKSGAGPESSTARAGKSFSNS
ncbi:MAG: hypothetical protein WDO17_01165 [Alphaproteobacteria bacterium]